MRDILLCYKGVNGAITFRGFDQIEMVDRDSANGYFKLIGYFDDKHIVLGGYRESKKCLEVFNSIINTINRGAPRVIDIRSFQKFEHLDGQNVSRTSLF